MKRNYDEKRLVKTNKKILSKIINFFKNLFKSKKYDSTKEESENIPIVKNINFRNNMQIKEDYEKIELLKIQKKFKTGEILEDDIPENYYNKLLQLYDEQNEKIRKEIENNKRKIAEILSQMRNNNK